MSPKRIAATPVPSVGKAHGELCENSMTRALLAMTWVRDEDPRVVWRRLDLLTRTELHALVIALAAACRVDVPISTFWSWTDGLAA